MVDAVRAKLFVNAEATNKGRKSGGMCIDGGA